MKFWILAICALSLTACVSAAALKPSEPESGDIFPSSPDSEPETDAIVPAAQPPNLPNLGPAPELENDVWLNVDGPLRLANLRGQVVALDMWTFG